MPNPQAQPIILSTRQQALLEQIASRVTNSYNLVTRALADSRGSQRSEQHSAQSTTAEHLKHQILDFLDYFNRTLAKPFVWKFVGFPDSD